MRLTAVKRTLTRLGWSGVQGLLHPAEAMDLGRDWPEMDALLVAEEWPFVRADFEVSQAQPVHAAHVVRRAGQVAGFFTAHAFGDVGYLDMMIVAEAWRRRGVARPLFVAAMARLASCRGLVVHTTHDSARLVRLLGFAPGATYTLLARDGDATPRSPRADPVDPDPAIALDGLTFGVERPAWTGTWLARPDTALIGLDHNGGLAAFACLRERRDGAWGLDLLACPDPALLGPLVERILERCGDRRLECFVRDGGPLEHVLRERGFAMPDFFGDIGPLVEWRRGDTAGVGDGPGVHSLLWL